MVRQNRALGFIFVFSVIIIGAILLRSGQFLMFGDSPTPPAADVAAKGPSQESMGDPVPAQDKIPAASVNSEEKKNFSDMVKMMNDCLHMTSAIPETISPTSEFLLSYLQTEWGNFESADQWINWHFTTKDGAERRLRLEVMDNDSNEGGVAIKGRELHVYAVDKEGLPIPIKLENVTTHNPTDEMINSVLKEGDVFFKEKASTAVFPQGASIQYVEKNGNLDSIEIHQATTIFRCSSFKNVSVSCLCTK